MTTFHPRWSGLPRSHCKTVGGRWRWLAVAKRAGELRWLHLPTPYRLGMAATIYSQKRLNHKLFYCATLHRKVTSRTLLATAFKL